MEKEQITRDKITNAVIKDLTSRAERGYTKYNTTLTGTSLRVYS